MDDVQAENAQLRLALQEARGSLRAELEATQIALQESQQEVERLRGDLNGATRDVIYLTKERDRLQEEVERLKEK